MYFVKSQALGEHDQINEFCSVGILLILMAVLEYIVCTVLYLPIYLAPFFTFLWMTINEIF